MTTPKPTVLIIDDERHTREGLERALRPKYHILLADNGLTGYQLLQSQPVDVVLTDLRMPGMDGMTFIKQVATREDSPLIIMLTAYGSVQTAVEAMKIGAYDYLSKPVNLDNLEMMIERGLESRKLRTENEALRQALDNRYGLEGIIGNSRAMSTIFETISQVAPARTTVLLSGESGTGKELMAHVIHRLSPRANQPFIAVHCAALNQNLLESELFGHEKGAYTGAHDKQLGRFEKADGGTLFLDEVGEIDISTQIKLLRVLETRTFERVGGNSPIEVDVRLIAATNRDLKSRVEAGKFREDLYYRLNVVSIELPPLRKHPEDIPLLLTHFLQFFSRENNKPMKGFTTEAVKVLMAYDWPGNVREVRNTVERMLVMARGSSLTLNDVPVEIRGAVGASLAGPDSSVEARAATSAGESMLNLDTQERNLIVKALKECRGNRSLAARKLGIGRRTLYRKLAVFGLDRPNKIPDSPEVNSSEAPASPPTFPVFPGLKEQTPL